MKTVLSILIYFKKFNHFCKNRMINFYKNSLMFSYRRLLKLFRGTCNVWILCLFGILCGLAIVADYYSNYGIVHGVFGRIFWRNEILVDLSKNCIKLYVRKYLLILYICKVYIYQISCQRKNFRKENFWWIMTSVGYQILAFGIPVIMLIGNEHLHFIATN